MSETAALFLGSAVWFLAAAGFLVSSAVNAVAKAIRESK